ncbi:hypothetical protein [Roseovarius litoreus]|uniref:hypothetical protein n=1 Tax=Roseovarius litoreus TaxID=1155722 RepID=UPI00122C5869|nr:hypothetical protein [Roseovarius litoreus]
MTPGGDAFGAGIGKVVQHGTASPTQANRMTIAGHPTFRSRTPKLMQSKNNGLQSIVDTIHQQHIQR